LRSVAAHILRLGGYLVESVADGALAVRRFREAHAAGEPFHVVIVDLTVPGGVGGLEAARGIREVDPNARLIVSSGYSSDPVMSDFRSHGFAGVVTKPYTVAELRRAVDSALREPG